MSQVWVGVGSAGEGPMTTWRHEWLVRKGRDGWPYYVEHRWYNKRRGGQCLIVYYDRPGWHTEWDPYHWGRPDKVVHRERKRAWREPR